MPQGPLVLFAEDEAIIAMATETALEEAGYKVLHVASGKMAIDELEKHPSEFAALITDIRLGSGIDGWKVAKRARELNPALPIVYVSGDSASDWAHNGVPESVMLQKPFALAQLILAVSQLLNNQLSSVLTEQSKPIE